MSATKAFGSPIEELVGDELVKFARLNMREAGTVQDTIRSARLRAAKAAASEADGISPSDRAAFILQASQEPVSDEAVYKYVGQAGAAREVLTTSLTKQGRTKPDIDTVLDNLDLVTAASLARLALGLLAYTPADRIGKPEERNWGAERELIQELVPHAGDPSELTREQYEQALSLANARLEAKKAQQQAA